MKLLKKVLSGRRLGSRRIAEKVKTVRRKLASYVDKNPLRSFYFSLGLLVIMIIASNLIGNPKPEKKETVAVVKDIEVFSIGTVPHVNVLAKVEKSGVITITALTPGVVQYIKTPVGTKVTKGKNLLGLSTNYQGGNTSSISRQLAAVQYNTATETKDLQQDLIKKQRELAEKADTNADELRKITDLSIGETEDLIRLNDEIITSLDTSIANLVNTNVNGSNDALILSTKQLKTQFIAARNGARQGARMAIFGGADNSKTPALLSDMQKDLALKQLELQEKMIDVNIEVARLQLSLTRVVEGMMYPASPIAGIVDRVSVHVGQVINPGTELMVISGDADNKSIKASAYVSSGIARRISATEDSVLTLKNGATVKTRPLYVSQEGINDTLHGVYFVIPQEFAGDVTDNGYISVELPLGYSDTTAAVPFIPIDAVFQSKDADVVYVDREGVAVARTVQLGEVLGSFVEVKSGLVGGDFVILNRTVIAGDKVRRATP